MAMTPSSMAPLGMTAADFSLPDGKNTNYTLTEVMGSKGLLVMFICNHCPFVKHIAGFLPELHSELDTLGIGAVAINSNDISDYPGDAPALMVKNAEKHGFTFPYLYDESQQTAKDYDAACTPDFFLFDASHRLYYRGQMDSSRPGNGYPTNGEDILRAAGCMVEGKAYTGKQNPSIGCNIKWKKAQS